MPSAAMALPPDPVTGVPRPCVGRTLQNLMGLTLPVRLRNLVRFTWDTLYPHHDKLQNLFPMRLTAVARRGRPVRAAAESGAAQRDGAAEPSITAHNSETQVQKDSGGDVRFLTTQGLGGPEGGAAESGFARRTQEPRFQSDAPGSGPAGPENFGYFPSLESSSPDGETSPIFRPARRRLLI